MRALLRLGILLALTPLVACSPGGEAASGPEIQIRDAHARPSRGVPVGAAFLTIHNGGAGADRLAEVRSEAAARVELHRTFVENELARMEALPDGLEIPPGEEVVLRHGGPHIMLMGLARPLVAGEQFDVELVFERSGSRVVSVRVESAPE